MPIDDVGPHTSADLRVEPAKNNQAKGLRWAMDNEVITRVMQMLSYASAALVRTPL